MFNHKEEADRLNDKYKSLLIDQLPKYNHRTYNENVTYSLNTCMIDGKLFLT